jgi:hypothetical protein
MNRRAFLSALGVAPIAAAATVLPVRANEPRRLPSMRWPVSMMHPDAIICVKDGYFWFERDGVD